jgi:hypothetical protein
MKFITCLAWCLLVVGLQAREFKGRNGKVIEAEVVSKSPGKVVLRLAEGKEVEVPLSSLSEADQFYVAVWLSPEEKEKSLRAVKLDEVLAAQGYMPWSITMMEGQMVLAVTVDGQAMKLVIDHRNETPIMSKASVEAKGLKMKSVEGGGQVVGRVTPDLVGQGDKGIKNLEFLVADLPNLPPGIDGMIGGQTFVDHPARLDFVGKRLWVKVD